jgi:hypothetical protein
LSEADATRLSGHYDALARVKGYRVGAEERGRLLALRSDATPSEAADIDFLVATDRLLADTTTPAEEARVRGQQSASYDRGASRAGALTEDGGS